MSLDQLWAGWRSGYVASVSEHVADDGAAPDPDSLPDGEEEAGCVFCRIIASELPDEVRHVVYTGPSTVVVLNAYPYASGHLLVMPLRHVSELSALDADESAELWSTATTAASVIERAYSPDGLNLGANIGRAAGAGIPRHLHLHVLPRWIGDTNFMTTVASVRVMPEALSDTWARLHASWPS